VKIALAHKRLNLRGGTERDFYRMAEGLRDLGHEVHLFCTEFEIPAPQGTFAHKLPLLALGRTARLLSFAILSPRAIRPYQCDIVIGFGRMIRQDIVRSEGSSHRLFLQKMARREGTLHRFWHRVSFYHRALLALEAMQFRPQRYKKVLAVSREDKRELMAACGVPENKIAVLYNGVDLERFHPASRSRWREKIKKQWGIPMDAPLVLFVGSGFRRKGLDRLLKIWDTPRLHGVYFLVVGADAQLARYRSWGEKQAKGRVIFAGVQKNIESYYGAADLLTLLSFQDPFGNVVLEALASGLPALVSKEVGAAEVLTGELEQGILADADDPRELTQRIVQMLDGARWSSLSRVARETAERHSWKRYFQELERHLLTVAEPAP